MTPSSGLLTVNQVAEYLGLSRSQVYRLSDPADPNGDRLCFIQIGGVRRYDPADIRAWIESNKH